MDNVQGWASYLYEQHGHNIPDGLRDQIPKLASNPTYWSYIGTVYYYITLVSSYLRPIFNNLVRSITTKPDLATVALLLVILFISLKILGMIVGTVLYWFRLARSVAFYGSMIMLALWMYTRGPGGCAEDAGYWWGVWKGFYNHWSEQDSLARTMREQGIPSGGARWH
ncbi:Putative nuclear pore assembly and biogenesis protein, APQ12 [Septoria linicola]|uniref:Nuclear pore assembly and biogenesis protein, APQ12 n=1 Tax=Septoria linicola TaxID=215465 RepID=A0A9Q9AHV1_9PEZI|nr:putative nuclear pore assembly and biogenesis protein, APQ12 [Septoria linicola]USW47183.1 Putative nuclear pore assembly and biogenesis protein, APQ12 [Septoria linicola]